MWLGRLLRPTAGRVLLAIFRVRFVDAANVPSGGAVLAGNHVSHLDPTLLWCGAPRPVHFMAKSELYTGVVGWALRRVWTFPVNRGEADRSAISTATALLQAGELVGIFPEGTRQTGSELGPPHGGAAFIAMRAGVPVVPVAFVGTDRALPKGAKRPHLERVTIKYGAPVPPDAFAQGSRKERVTAMTAEIMRRIADELVSAKELHDAR